METHKLLIFHRNFKNEKNDPIFYKREFFQGICEYKCGFFEISTYFVRFHVMT